MVLLHEMSLVIMPPSVLIPAKLVSLRPLSLYGVENKVRERYKGSTNPHDMGYNNSGQHPVLKALEQRVGLAEVISGHVAATFAFLWTPVLQHQSPGRGRMRGRYIHCIFCFVQTSSFTLNASLE
jgi:hypothetical protein